MSGLQFFISLVLAIVLSIWTMTLPGKISSNKKLDAFVMSLKNPVQASKIITIIWVVLFIPITFICLIAAVAVLMGGEAMLSGIGFLQIISLGISLVLFLITPIIMIISIIRGVAYRKSQEITLSVVVQFTHIIILLLAVLFIFIVFVLGVLGIRI